jgi:hypothetical protein
MKNGQNWNRLAVAIVAMITISQLAVAQLVLDDFSTGKYQKTIKSGQRHKHAVGEHDRRQSRDALCAASRRSAVNQFPRASDTDES